MVMLLLAAGCSHDAANSGASPDSNGNGGTPSASDNSKPSAIKEVLATRRNITLPEGTTLEVTVDETLSSKSNQAGDKFAASLAAPVLREDKILLRKGTKLTGRVVEAKDSGRLHVPASIQVALASVDVEGKSYEIATNTVGETGASHKKRNAGFIGGGAAAGALIGGLAGGGKGALIGGAAGAGAGTAGAAATGKKDISIPAETRLTFKLTQSVTVSVKD
jgi:hypothetical protein